MKKYICADRDSFINEIEAEIMENPSKFYYFLGRIGTGKKYVLNQLENNLKNKFKIYTIVSDIFMEKKQTPLKHKFEVSFQFNCFIGLSLSAVKNDDSKLNYIISNLKSLTLKKNIIISAVDYDNLSSEGRDLIFTIVSNKKTIEEKIKKKITIIITGNYDYFNGNHDVLNVSFKDYTKADIYNYLLIKQNYLPAKLQDNKISQIYKLCGTNFNLVNCYCDYIVEAETDGSIEAIVDKKLNYYISSGYKYNLSKENLENILYTSSLSIKTFTPKMISFINNDNIDDIKSGFICAETECFFESRYHNEFPEYLFVSQEEKNYLCKCDILHHDDRLIQYYIYISDSAEDEYFERAQFLYHHYKKINHQVLALLVLAISKSYLLNDNILKEKVQSFFNTYASDPQIQSVFFDSCIAYEYHYSMQYNNSSEIIKNLKFSVLHNVLAAELRRLQFKNGQLGRVLSPKEMMDLVHQLDAYVENGLLLMDNGLFKTKEEKLLSLKIIFDIMPYFLDSSNDKEVFNKLYNKSLLIVKYIDEHFEKKSYSEYIINIFNRKAFLFAPPCTALLYYEQAEAYFREHNILNEYAITLASKAGINIDLHNYDLAVSNCQEALDIINENNFEIPQVEKIYNNLYISQFLAFEQKNISIPKLREYAKLKIKDLEKLVTDMPCGKNHVILTNISSLYLYSNNTTQYLKTKKRIEKSLNCTDVSDVQDTSVNDFYRYYFAWFEFYRYLKNEEWNKCTEIVGNLSKFYPSIFHDYKKMDLRIEAANYLVQYKINPSLLKFCLNFLDYAPSNKKDSMSRGLLLSDLQFTSWG